MLWIAAILITVVGIGLVVALGRRENPRKNLARLSWLAALFGLLTALAYVFALVSAFSDPGAADSAFRVVFARLFAATGYIGLIFGFFLIAFVAGQRAKRFRL